MTAQLSSAPSGRQYTQPRAVIVQLFEWPWSDIATECEQWLGPKGYGAVQISPPYGQLATVTHPQAEQLSWYQQYQPVSYDLSDRTNQRAELAAMVSRCHQAGVKVYADVAINHMASIHAVEDSGEINLVVADASVSAPGIRDDSPIDISSEATQSAIAAAMNELLALGIAGFRIDAANYSSPKHLTKILRRLRSLNLRLYPNGGRPFIYQEILHSATASSQSADYFNNGSVTEFRYGRNLGEQVRYGQLKNLVLFGEAWGMIPSHKAIVFIDNHKTQRSGDRNIVTFYSPSDDGASYRLANVFMLAWPYGQPQVMSSYDWPREQRRWVGPPVDDQGQTLPVSCGDGWICEHRWPEIANMVEFRNVTQAATTINHWWDNGSNQIAFARGDQGFVAINNEATILSQTLMTGLPPGIYCNVLASQDAVSHDPVDSCARQTVEVDAAGYATVEVPPYRAMALHVDAQR